MFRHFSLNLLTIVVQLVLTLGGGVLAARLLGPELRGEFAAIQMMPQALMAFVWWGVPQAMVYFAARKSEKAGEIMPAGLLLMAAAAVPVLLVGWVAMPWLMGHYGADFVWYSRFYMVVMVGLVVASSALSNTFMGLKDYVQFNVLRLLPTVLYVAAIGVAFWRVEVVWIVAVYALLYAVLVLPYGLWAYGRFVAKKIVFSIAKVREMAPYALATFSTSVPGLAGQRLDQFFVLALLDARALGIYAVALGVGQMFGALQTASGNIILPYLAENSHDGARQRQIFGRIVRVTAMYSVPLVAGLVVVLPWLVVGLFGRDFAGAIWPSFWLICAAAVVGMNGVLADGFRGLHKPRLPLGPEVAGLLVKLAGLLLMGQAVTLDGAALTALAGASITLIYNMVLYHRQVERVDGRWLREGGQDVVVIWAHGWAVVVRRLKLFWR